MSAEVGVLVNLVLCALNLAAVVALYLAGSFMIALLCAFGAGWAAAFAVAGYFE